MQARLLARCCSERGPFGALLGDKLGEQARRKLPHGGYSTDCSAFPLRISQECDQNPRVWEAKPTTALGPPAGAVHRPRWGGCDRLIFCDNFFSVRQKCGTVNLRQRTQVDCEVAVRQQESGRLCDIGSRRTRGRRRLRGCAKEAIRGNAHGLLDRRAAPLRGSR